MLQKRKLLGKSYYRSLFHDKGRYHIETSQPVNLLPKSMDWFLYDNGLRRERVHKGTRGNLTDLNVFPEIIRKDRLASLDSYHQLHLLALRDWLNQYFFTKLIVHCVVQHTNIQNPIKHLRCLIPLTIFAKRSIMIFDRVQ